MTAAADAACEEASVIEMQNVSKVFRTDQIETHALKGFSLRVAAGEFVAITGPSGSGKTTLLNVAGLLDEFDSGSYSLDGSDVTKLSDDDRSRIRNRKIGFVFQGFNLIPDLSVYDNVDTPLRYRGMRASERHDRVRASIDKVGLTSRIDHLPSQLSGGQQQRVALARALAGDPKVLFADEPTGNLDTEMSGQIIDLLQDINKHGTTIVMVTHSPELAGRASRRIRIVDGVVADGH
jgi:putative ABC transport system ATP-binding protein